MFYVTWKSFSSIKGVSMAIRLFSHNYLMGYVDSNSSGFMVVSENSSIKSFHYRFLMREILDIEKNHRNLSKEKLILFVLWHIVFLKPTCLHMFSSYCFCKNYLKVLLSSQPKIQFFYLTYQLRQYMICTWATL